MRRRFCLSIAIAIAVAVALTTIPLSAEEGVELGAPSRNVGYVAESSRIFELVILVATAAIVVGVAAAVVGLIRAFIAQIKPSKARDDIGWLTTEATNIAPTQRKVIPEYATQVGAHQLALLREYHSHGLAQSRASFWFSLVFAAIGFSAIVLANAALTGRRAAARV
jgi:Cyanobacterial TRADD-N associated 2-Transmembrane domain